MTTVDQTSKRKRDCPRRQGLSRAFWRLWTANTVSSLGDGLAIVAFPLAAALLTRSPLLVAGVVFAQRLPWLLLSIPAGVLVDRLPRGRFMAVLDLLRGLLLVGMAAGLTVDALTLPLLYVCAFVLGTADTAFAAASHASVPVLVEDSGLERANGLLFATETAGMHLIGPALGGVVFTAAVALPFAVDAVTFLVSSAFVSSLVKHLPAPPVVAQQNPRQDLVAGWQAFWGNEVLRYLSFLTAGLVFAQGMVLGILVLFALDVLGLGASGFGLFLGIGAIGNVIGALVGSRISDRFPPQQVVVGAALMSAVAFVGVGASTAVVTATAFFVLESFAVAVGSVVSLSLRQRLVPNELLGRVGTCFRTFIWGAMPLGTAVGGLVAEAVDVRMPVLLAGLMQLLVVALVAPAFVRVLRADTRITGHLVAGSAG